MEFVGTFTEEELMMKKDREETEKMKAETGLNYVLTKIVTKNKKPYGLSVWVCSYDEYMNDVNEI